MKMFNELKALSWSNRYVYIEFMALLMTTQKYKVSTISIISVPVRCAEGTFLFCAVMGMFDCSFYSYSLFFITATHLIFMGWLRTFNSGTFMKLPNRLLSLCAPMYYNTYTQLLKLSCSPLYSKYIDIPFKCTPMT